MHAQVREEGTQGQAGGGQRVEGAEPVSGKKLEEADLESPESLEISPASDNPGQKMRIFDINTGICEYRTLLHDNVTNDLVPSDCYNSTECIACLNPLSFHNCPGSFSQSGCSHSLNCQLGSCDCSHLNRMTSFLNLSKGTIKRHRRQQIESPSSDFGLQKARAATKQRIKDSMKPFDNDQSLTFKSVTASSLFEEFINMMKGNFKEDMLRYIVKESKTLPIIDIDFEKQQRTYSKAELDGFSKTVGFSDYDCEINELLSQCHNFILNEPVITCSKPIYERELPNKPMEIDLSGESQDIPYVKNINLEKEMAHKKPDGQSVNAHLRVSESPGDICQRYAALEADDIERCELIIRTSPGTLSAAFFVNDSGSNIQLISVQNLSRLGGDKKRIIPRKSSIENSSGQNTLVLGEIELELYATQDSTLIFMGKFNFVVIDNPDFKEILLGMNCLNTMKQELKRDPVTKGSFIGLTCPRGKKYCYQYTSNCPSYRTVRSTRDKSLKAGRSSTLQLSFPLSVAEYIFCSEEMTHTSVWHNQIKIKPSLTPQKLTYGDILTTKKIIIKPIESYHVKMGDDIHNTFGFPNHFDCPCRNDQEDIYIESQSFYTEHGESKYKGHGIIQEPLSEIDLKIGINIDEIAKQPESDEAIIGHLDSETQSIIRAINNKHHKAFNSPEDPIGLFNAKEFHVDFVPNSSFYQPPLNIKGDRAIALDHEIKKLLRVGVIEKAKGAGDCNIPAFVVGKVKGRALLAQKLGKQDKTYDSYRLVLDMRLANSKMIGHGGVLLPSQDDLLTRMHSKFTACLDVSSAFHALAYTKETANKMRFTHRGTQYISKRAIMGSLPSSQHLEEAMNLMFGQNDFEAFLKSKSFNEELLLRDLLLIYCDDIIIGCPTMEQFFFVYEFVLQQIARFGMKLEMKKIKVLQPSTTILGFDFSREEDGTMTHCIKQSKVDQFLGLPTPRSKRMLSSYLSSSAIYFKNIIGAKLIMSPLYLFLRSSSNVFEYCHFRALSMLRLMMSLNLKQACMNPDKMLAILSDSSMIATHGVVTQFVKKQDKVDLYPIMCSSKMYDKAAARQPSIYKECMGVLNIVKQAEHLIRANKVATYVISDCRPLAYGLRARSTTIGLAESAIYLSSLPRLKILHLRGSEIRACDVYSRLFSFGLARKERFDKDKAMIFKNHFFGEMAYSVSDLEKIIEKHDNATYLQLSPIKPGKLTTSDIYAKIMEHDTETEYFRGLFNGYDAIDKHHSFWRPGIKNDGREHITEAEFRNYVNSGTFKEFRDQLDAQGITDDKVFYSVNNGILCEVTQPSLFISQGFPYTFDRDANHDVTLCVTMQCPPQCHKQPVPGPQLFIHTKCGQLSSTHTENFKLCSSLIEYNDMHGYFDTMYKCDVAHEVPKTWELVIQNTNNTPLTVKPISHFPVTAALGARIISGTMSRCLYSGVEGQEEHRALSEITDPEKCQFSQESLTFFNSTKIKDSAVSRSFKPIKSDNLPQATTQEQEVNRELNKTSIMSLLMVAQASHFGMPHFSEFILEMQRGSKAIGSILDKIPDKNNFYYFKRYTFAKDKKGLLWVSKGDKKASRLVVPHWFVTILVKNLHSGPIHLSALGMATLINKTFLMIRDQLPAGKFAKDPFELPFDHKKEITEICSNAAKQCIKCLLAKPSVIHSMSGSHRHLETSSPGAVYSLDLLEGLPKTPSPNNYTCILICVCRASNFMVALPQKSTSQSETMRNFLTIYSIIGSNLVAVESDGSSTFAKVSEFLCTRGILHKRYGPRSQTQGSAENSIKFLRHLLSTSVFDIDIERRHLWDAILPDLNLTINNLVVKPTHQTFSRRELFFNPFSNSSQLSNIHVNNIYQALQKLRHHREEVIRKLAKLNTIPEIRVGDIVLLKRRKLEILPKEGVRAFLPPTAAQLYRVVAMSPLYCRVNSLLDNSFRTIARNKITRLDVHDWLEANNTVPGIIRTIYQSHKYIPGFAKRPSFEKLRKDGLIDGEQVDNHISNCSGECPLLKDIPAGLFYQDDLEDGEWEAESSPPEAIPMGDQADPDDQLEGPDTPPSGLTNQGDDGNDTGQSQLSALTPDENDFRRVTRSMTKPKTFYSSLTHFAAPKSAVLTFTHLTRIPESRREKSILKKPNSRSKIKTLSFADHYLVTEFNEVPGTNWISCLYPTKEC